MYYHPSENIAYIAHTKTASTSIADALIKNGWVQSGQHHSITKGRIKKDTRVLSVVRDPMDWYVSWFHHYRSKDRFFDWFEWFLSNTHRMLRDGDFPGLPLTTHLVFFDELNVGFNDALNDVGLESIDIPRMNVSPRDSRVAADFFDADSIELIGTEKFPLMLLYEELLSFKGSRSYLPVKGHVKTLALDWESTIRS